MDSQVSTSFGKFKRGEGRKVNGDSRCRMRQYSVDVEGSNAYTRRACRLKRSGSGLDRFDRLSTLP